MAIEHITVCQNIDTSNEGVGNLIFTPLLQAYDWAEGSEVTGSGLSAIGKYYFDSECYFTLRPANLNYGLIVTIFCGGTSKEFELGIDQTGLHYTAGVGKTDKAVGVCIGYQESNGSGTTNPRSYNILYGNILDIDGISSKAIIFTNENTYSNSDNGYTIISSKGASNEAVFKSVIDSTRKGYLIPVTDSTFGGIFKDIYMMACAPIQFNKMKVADKKYLCGKAFCLADE